MKKRHYILLALILVTSALVACGGGYLKYELFPKLGIETEESVISLPFVLAADEILSSQVSEGLAELNAPVETVLETTVPTTVPEETVPETTAETMPPETTEATEPAPVYIAVDESWFDDVLFIGDSRTTGLRDAARLGDADYFCSVGMSVYSVLKSSCTDLDFKEKTLETVLKRKEYGKIYIHLGLNELSEKVDKIMTQYRKVVDFIHEKQPEAVIILQSVMTVTEEKTYNPNYAMENIQEINRQIRELAEEKGFLFCDVNSWAGDENGFLRKDIAYGTSHLCGGGYVAWSEWLLEDAGWYGIE